MKQICPYCHTKVKKKDSIDCLSKASYGKAGMVLSILSICICLLFFSIVSSFLPAVSLYYTVYEKLTVAIALTFIHTALATIGLCFSAYERNLRKTGVNLAGLVISIVTLSFSLIQFLTILSA